MTNSKPPCDKSNSADADCAHPGMTVGENSKPEMTIEALAADSAERVDQVPTPTLEGRQNELSGPQSFSPPPSSPRHRWLLTLLAWLVNQVVTVALTILVWQYQESTKIAVFHYSATVVKPCEVERERYLPPSISSSNEYNVVLVCLENPGPVVLTNLHIGIDLPGPVLAVMTPYIFDFTTSDGIPLAGTTNKFKYKNTIGVRLASLNPGRRVGFRVIYEGSATGCEMQCQTTETRGTSIPWSDHFNPLVALKWTRQDFKF